MELSNKFFEDQFNRKANSFMSFTLFAKSLYLSGKTLYKKFSDDLTFLENGVDPKELPYLDVFFIYLMLYGLAIENLLKSLIIKNGTSLYQNGVINKRYRTHNLNSLFDSCGLKKSNDEKEILDILSEFVLWAGKYSVPSKIQDMKKLFSPAKQLIVPEKLYERLLSEVEK